MLLPNPDMSKRIMEERTRDRLREAETRRLLREAGIDQRGWFSRQACRLLAWVGHLLVALGRRLERFEGTSVAASQAQGTSEVPSGMQIIR